MLYFSFTYSNTPKSLALNLLQGTYYASLRTLHSCCCCQPTARYAPKPQPGNEQSLKPDPRQSEITRPHLKIFMFSPNHHEMPQLVQSKMISDALDAPNTIITAAAVASAADVLALGSASGAVYLFDRYAMC
jgi:hypothetical protein